MTTYNEAAQAIVNRAAASIGLDLRAQVIAADLSGGDPGPGRELLGLAVKKSPWLIVLDLRLIDDRDDEDQQRTALHELAHAETRLTRHTLGFFLCACDFQRRAGLAMDYDMQRYDGHESTRPLPELLAHYEQHADALAALPAGSVGHRAAEIEQRATEGQPLRLFFALMAAVAAVVVAGSWLLSA